MSQYHLMVLTYEGTELLFLPLHKAGLISDFHTEATIHVENRLQATTSDA